MYPYTSCCGKAARSFARRAAPRCAPGAALFGSLLCALLAAPAAHAALGGAPMPTPAGASVSTLSAAAAAAATGNASAAARAAVQGAASGASTPPAYTVQQTTLANGTVVREYLTQGGTVFGVAWDGPQMPNLATLLGSYFPQYTAGVKASHAAGRVRGPGVVENSNVVVHSGGHMGAFSGQAWLPQALPAGVSASDIQ
ncbi:uncharacterized protein DUF2844 [Paraburkholderia silvatlantica]|uniref:Uncharacterized protein DUF2844 n=1 Tax=Paraburkholderia silvatlantica TaxID=321895 RepID=A0A2V4U3J4_9BURK|nr:uncharacterized protein DUF2844 [Paraburkholderia silvatlantica]